MGLEPTLREQQQIADALQRRCESLTAVERRAEILVSGSFVVAVAALLLAFPPTVEQWHPAAAIACLLALTVALRAEFDIGSGFTVPSQLAFVPLMFAVPPSMAPVVVVLALVVAYLPDVLHGELRAVRLLRFPSNAWFSVGPAVVLGLAGAPAASEAAPQVLLAALAAQFFCDLAGSTVMSVMVYGSRLRDQLAEAWVYAVDLALTPLGLLIAWHLTATPWGALVLAPLLVMLGLFGHERRRRVESLVELNSAYRGTALLLGSVVEADDQYTAEHSRGVVELALQVGQRLNLNAEQTRNLEFGALLHDVGKVVIPKEIINKPGKLDAREWEIIKTHTTEGQRMLDQVGGFMSDVGRIVRSHHERWDGNGYPDQLAGEAIPIESRIISCCDTWSAMTTDRPYRAALPLHAAATELLASAGSQLDASIVAALIDLVHPAPASAAFDEGASRVLAANDATLNLA